MDFDNVDVELMLVALGFENRRQTGRTYMGMKECRKGNGCTFTPGRSTNAVSWLLSLAI